MILNINGKDIKFGFGLYFLGKAQKLYNVDLDELLGSIIKNPIADMVDLMYYSAKCEAELDEVKLDLTKREFVDYLEKTDDFKNVDGILSKWSVKFVDSIKGHFLPKEDNEELTGSKKK